MNCRRCNSPTKGAELCLTCGSIWHKLCSDIVAEQTRYLDSRYKLFLLETKGRTHPISQAEGKGV